MLYGVSVMSLMTCRRCMVIDAVHAPGVSERSELNYTKVTLRGVPSTLHNGIDGACNLNRNMKFMLQL